MPGYLLRDIPGVPSCSPRVFRLTWIQEGLQGWSPRTLTPALFSPRGPPQRATGLLSSCKWPGVREASLTWSHLLSCHRASSQMGRSSSSLSHYLKCSVLTRLAAHWLTLKGRALPSVLPIPALIMLHSLSNCGPQGQTSPRLGVMPPFSYEGNQL